MWTLKASRGHPARNDSIDLKWTYAMSTDSVIWRDMVVGYTRFERYPTLSHVRALRVMNDM